ncbi:MAG: permease-like cell division protein FtsX [Actinomycetota bacterium]|nr:permease-like cell division protein FtsX [Actinomycetota bacterium]
MAINPGYFFGEAINSFRRNWVMSLVAVTIIYISLLLVGSFFLTSALLSKIISSVESKVSVQVFLKDGAAPADVQTLQSNIQRIANVEGISYVSKAQALERFKERTKNTPQLVEQLRGNPLPASLEVKLKDPREVKAVVEVIKKDAALAKVIKNPANPEADDIKYGQNVVEQLFKATGVVRVFVLVFLILLLVVSLVLIGNTIRLAIYSRRREIGIMRLVGASNWFIRTPFLMEGVMQSLIGSILAILTLVAAQSLIVPWLQSNLRFLPVDIGGGTIAQLAALLIIAGVSIGLVGSGAAVARYLKV